HVPMDLICEHYEKRATESGLLVSDATLISPYAGGIPNTPGLWTEEQVNGWKSVVDAVHKKKGIIYNQLWHIGHTTSSSLMPNNVKPVPLSVISIQGKSILTGHYYEIPQLIQDFVIGAKNAIKAGFDDVEPRGATGK
ncbi:hypothetical protein BDA99DRAFT_438574, partial [Phascolomyces articulosus]